MADPGPLARMFWVDEELECNVYLDGIIALVDAFHLQHNLNFAHKNPEAVCCPLLSWVARFAVVDGMCVEIVQKQVIHQLGYADRILLNKTDLGSYNAPHHTVAARHSAQHRISCRFHHFSCAHPLVVFVFSCIVVGA